MAIRCLDDHIRHLEINSYEMDTEQHMLWMVAFKSSLALIFFVYETYSSEVVLGEEAVRVACQQCRFSTVSRPYEDNLQLPIQVRIAH